MTLWTVTCQAPLSIGLFRQEYWSGLPFPFPGDLPNAGIEPMSPVLAGRFFPTEPPGKPPGKQSLTEFKRMGSTRWLQIIDILKIDRITKGKR